MSECLDTIPNQAESQTCSCATRLVLKLKATYLLDPSSLLSAATECLVLLDLFQNNSWC